MSKIFLEFGNFYCQLGTSDSVKMQSLAFCLATEQSGSYCNHSVKTHNSRNIFPIQKSGSKPRIIPVLYSESDKTQRRQKRIICEYLKTGAIDVD